MANYNTHAKNKIIKECKHDWMFKYTLNDTWKVYKCVKCGVKGNYTKVYS